MGLLTARAVILRAQTLIADKTAVRWPLDEMLRWLNDGQRQVVSLRPDAASATVKFQLVPGTKQGLPPNAWRLLDIIRNLGSDGQTPGRAIIYCERYILDSQNPDWHNAPASGTVLHHTYDGREPTTWYCFPPQPASGNSYVDMVVSRSPVDCTLENVANDDGVTTGTEDSQISILDVYANSLIDFIVYRAESKNESFVTSGLAAQSFNSFLTGLGLKTQVDKSYDPKKNAPPGVNRNVPGNTGTFGDG